LQGILSFRQVSFDDFSSKAAYCVGDVENSQAFVLEQPQLLLPNRAEESVRTTNKQMNATVLQQLPRQERTTKLLAPNI